MEYVHKHANLGHLLPDESPGSLRNIMCHLRTWGHLHFTTVESRDHIIKHSVDAHSTCHLAKPKEGRAL